MLAMGTHRDPVGFKGILPQKGESHGQQHIEDEVGAAWGLRTMGLSEAPMRTSLSHAGPISSQPLNLKP